MNYMLLIYGLGDDQPVQSLPEDMQATPENWGRYDVEIQASGVYVSGEALHPQDQSKTVRYTNGTPLVTDGPFAETKEYLGGFYVVNVEHRDAAIEWAKKMPLGNGVVEIREAVVF